MQLILVFVVILLQEVLVNLGEVMKVEGTPGVDAFMDAEELPVFLGNCQSCLMNGLMRGRRSVVNFWYLGEWESSKAHCLRGIYLQMRFRSQQIVLHCS